MSEEKDPTARVTMLWPEDLKEKVRAEVGSRKLTSFTIDAVKTKLGLPVEKEITPKDLNDVKFLAQRLADAIAMRGTGPKEPGYEFDPKVALEEVGLPEWIDTAGWPEELAHLVKPAEVPVKAPRKPKPLPEPKEPTLDREGGIKGLLNHFGVTEEVNPPLAHHPVGDGDSDELHRPMALTKPESELPAVGDPDTVRSEPLTPKGSDLLERVRAKAAEKGVDISGVDFMSASAVDKPRPREELEEKLAQIQPVENEVVRLPEPEPEKPSGAKPMARSDVCQKCGSELVGGECWECF